VRLIFRLTGYVGVGKVEVVAEDVGEGDLLDLGELSRPKLDPGEQFSVVTQLIPNQSNRRSTVQ
jgi:hypothetical protein